VGGLGSGERWSKKRVVESCRSIDAASLKRWNMLVPGTAGRTGSFHWGDKETGSSVSYALTVGENTGTLRLLYSIQSQNAGLDYAVRLVTTSAGISGRHAGSWPK
jgi:hypothetical protein